ncbi:hypothetical protein F441_11450 [Phytophthora nicotianae CJ01A1]|uniref:Uncharacterized protein n=3 Tax=Phytophthora nicotianae TaxID=4792 RepID=V9EYE6_PHYNI|nr:hypothetical protein F443_11530 [Phytophthora nicotianae P1569]ETL90209.1 hypothetical protein L917_11024 [Phytophthora nicotianae]ETM43530.1 hypothetical protein L914_11053 [Phytophthora nicotianae]ETP13399.1 hypothetical protein F441_11450 [Phytophthora nicotianae CJ01A1]
MAGQPRTSRGKIPTAASKSDTMATWVNFRSDVAQRLGYLNPGFCLEFLGRRCVAQKIYQSSVTESVPTLFQAPERIESKFDYSRSSGRLCSVDWIRGQNALRFVKLRAWLPKNAFVAAGGGALITGSDQFTRVVG